MGSSSSKKSKRGANSSPPEDVVPYTGPNPQYHFFNHQVIMSFNWNRTQDSVLSYQINITSNVQDHYPMIAQKMAEGLRLLTFYRLPSNNTDEVMRRMRQVREVFLGLYCTYPSEPNSQQYQLRVEKSKIQPALIHGRFLLSAKMETNTQHLFQMLANMAEQGGRLVCIEITGQEQRSANLLAPALSHHKTLGCDLFFEMPVGEVREKFVYNVVCIPIDVGVGGMPPKATVHCDFLTHFTTQLNEGWKLVEIFYDKAARLASPMNMSTTMNSQWYFEKPAALLEDTNPRYTGCILDFEVLVKGFDDTQAPWEQLIQDMGNKGWELAVFLETPEIRISWGIPPTACVKVKLFFQRPILTTAPPPAYSQ